MSEKLRILEMIEKGEISPEEGIKLLSAVDSQEDTPSPENDESLSDMDILGLVDSGELSPAEGITRLKAASSSESGHSYSEEDHKSEDPPHISDQEMKRWKYWWQYPLYIGVGALVLSTLWINSAYQASGYNFWFFCAWVPFLASLLLVALSWRSKSGPWLHVRIISKGSSPERIAISIPLPIGTSSWALRNFGHLIPGIDESLIDEVIMALGKTSSDTPFHVKVEDDEDGEEVHVFIG